MYRRSIKCILDFFLALCLLVILSPILLFITSILLLIYRGNPFYIHQRPGKNELVFGLIKFKSMNDNRDETGTLLPDVQRVTAVGRFMRKFSLDELPQLLNVLKGDMSLIGPRPLLTQYLPLYNSSQARRHEVRPGMTGWAQINGRNNLSWNEKFDLDVWYVDNISFLLDLRILFITILKVIKREGINSASEKTMNTFHGNTSH